jgi:cellulose synthase operon protein C
MSIMSRRRASNQPQRKLRSKRLLVIFGVVVGIAVVLGLVFFVQSLRQAPALLDLARKTTTEGDYPNATRLYEEYIKYRPREAEVIAELGQVYDDYARTRTGRRKEADALWAKSFENYELALTLKPELSEERKKLAKLYSALKQFNNSERHIKLLLEQPENKNDPDLYVLAANSATDIDQKINYFRKSIDTGKGDPETYRALAVTIRIEKGKTNPQARIDADDIMRDLIKTRPNDLPARLVRARYNAEFGKLNESREDVRVAYETIPGGNTNQDVILLHADTLAADNLPAARAILEKGLVALPNNPALQLGLAEVEARSGNRARAKELLVECGTNFPPTEILLLDVADRLIDFGDTTTAEAIAKRIEPVPEFGTLVGYLRGRMELLQGNWPVAQKLLLEAIPNIEFHRKVNRKMGYLIKANVALAECYSRAGEVTNEVESLRKAAKLDEYNMPVRLKWIEALLKEGKLELAKDQLRGLSEATPGAKVLLAKLLLADELRKPLSAKKRDFKSFWAAVGTGAVPAELAVTVADAHLAEGNPAKAEAVLRESLKQKPNPTAYLRLAALQGVANTDNALAILTDAEKALGPNVDVQIARAAWLSRQAKPNVPAITQLADHAQLKSDSFRLKSAIGEVLLSIGATEPGTKLLQAAANEQPYDLSTRVMLFDVATNAKDKKLQADLITQIRKITGDDSPVVQFAEVIQELTMTPQLTPARRTEIDARLRDIDKKRPNWSTVARVRGQLAERDGYLDEAVEQYRTAIEQGEASEVIVLRTVQLLLDRQRFAQALQLLGKLSETGRLTPDLEARYRMLEAVATDDQAKAVQFMLSDFTKGSRNYQDQILRAIVLAQNGQLQQSKEAFAVARGLAPGQPEIYVNQVRVLKASGMPTDQLLKEIQQAEKEMTKAAGANTNATMMAMGAMYDIVGDTKQAANAYRSVIAVSPNDPEPPQRLLDVYLRENNRDAARQLVMELASKPTIRQEIVRWARRMRALLDTDGIGGFKAIPSAIALLDQNLQDGPSLDDERTKALIQARDPFQRRAAIRTLDESRSRGPLTPEHCYRIAFIQLQAGLKDEAEAALVEGTRNGLTANPNHLALLASLQTERGADTLAKNTVNRLKVLAPNQNISIMEEARLLARTDKPKAAELLNKLVVPGNAFDRAKTVGRALESVGCLAEAEALYKAFAESKDIPDGNHMPWVEFLIRQKRGVEAIPLALDNQARKPNCPMTITAQLLTAALRLPGLTPVPAEMNAEVDKFIATLAATQKDNADVLLAVAELADIRGRHEEALQAYRKAIAVQKNPAVKAQIVNNLALLTVLVKPNAGEEPLRLVNESIGDLGPEPFLLDTRGMIWLLSGDPKKAQDDLQAASTASPSPVYWYHLARAYDAQKSSAERNFALDKAKKLGLKKELLHPLEWPGYDQMVK